MSLQKNPPQRLLDLQKDGGGVGWVLLRASEFPGGSAILP